MASLQPLTFVILTTHMVYNQKAASLLHLFMLEKLAANVGTFFIVSHPCCHGDQIHVWHVKNNVIMKLHIQPVLFHTKFKTKSF